MKTTTEIIIQCFKKAKIDKNSPLFKLLCDAMDDHFISKKPIDKENVLFDMIMDGYSFYMGDFTISCADGAYNYNGNKDIIVSHPYNKAKGFKTVKDAMKYVENNS